MKISAILTAMLLALSLQITPVFAHSDKDKDSHEHAYSEDKDHHDKDGAKDNDRSEHGDSHRDAGRTDASGHPVVNDGFMPDWWPF